VAAMRMIALVKLAARSAAAPRVCHPAPRIEG
jgi:hypothetical protein